MTLYTDDDHRYVVPDLQISSHFESDHVPSDVPAKYRCGCETHANLRGSANGSAVRSVRGGKSAQTDELVPPDDNVCADCGLPYGSPAFQDLIIPNDIWAYISPTGDEGGILCACCICARLERGGISRVPGAFLSGPVDTVSPTVMEAYRRVENTARAIAIAPSYRQSHHELQPSTEDSPPGQLAERERNQSLPIPNEVRVRIKDVPAKEGADAPERSEVPVPGACDGGRPRVGYRPEGQVGTFASRDEALEPATQPSLEAEKGAGTVVAGIDGGRDSSIIRGGIDAAGAALAKGDPERTPQGRYFEGGAYRDQNADKPDYSGYLSPLVIRAYGAYMLKHQRQSDGEMRDSDNWKQGIPRDSYLESAWRHLLDLWLEHEGWDSRDGIDEALGGLLFNVAGYWHELLKERR